MNKPLWDRFFGSLLGRAFETGTDPLATLGYILGGAMFGVLVVGLLFLVARWFVRWGYEEITIRRGRDSLVDRRGHTRRRAVSREGLPGVRRRRKSDYPVKGERT